MLSVAPVPAMAKKKASSPTNRPARKKPARKEQPRKLWYRLTTTTEGRYSTDGTPERGMTLEQNMRWTASSRTAFILSRSDLTDTRTQKKIPGFSFSAGVAGQLQSMNSTETEYRPTCTPDVRAFRQTAPVGVQGYVSGYLPNDRKNARVDADTVLAEVASPPRRSDTGVNSWSGYECTNASGQVYSSQEKPPDAPGSAYVPMFCSYDPASLNMRYEVKGSVRFGRAFTITVTCEAWWDAATSGGIGSRRTIDYQLKFTPCPRGGRTTKGC